MILTVTLNPLLERRFTYDKVNFGSVNRNAASELAAGGKGINVSRQLKKFGIKSFNYFFSGGVNGKQFREVLKTEGLDFTHINIKNETRDCAVIVSKDDSIVSSFFSSDPKISSSEVEEFKSKLDKMIQNCEIVVFSGSSPCKETDSIFPYGIQLANKYDKISVCDTYGLHLKECIDAVPTIIHNNLSEVQNSLSIVLNDEKSILDYLQNLYQKNIIRVFLTDGSNNFYASNFDYIYKIKPVNVIEKDSTGSGDSFAAGLIYGWVNSEVFEETLKFATAVAGLNAASFETASVNLMDAVNLKEKVEIIPIGKKTKTIDDSPREI